MYTAVIKGICLRIFSNKIAYRKFFPLAARKVAFKLNVHITRDAGNPKPKETYF